MQKSIPARKAVAPCYGHIGGILGELFFKMMLDEKWIYQSNGRDYDITEKGRSKLTEMGIDLKKLEGTKRKILVACCDRIGGQIFDHAGAYLSQLIKECFFENEWLEKTGEKEYAITENGKEHFAGYGIVIEPR